MRVTGDRCAGGAPGAASSRTAATTAPVITRSPVGKPAARPRTGLCSPSQVHARHYSGPPIAAPRSLSPPLPPPTPPPSPLLPPPPSSPCYSDRKPMALPSHPPYFFSPVLFPPPSFPPFSSYSPPRLSPSLLFSFFLPPPQFYI